MWYSFAIKYLIQIMFKKLLIVVLSVGLSVGTVFALGGFTDQADIPEWAVSSVSEMQGMGVINGYSDGSFGPNNSVTRAELATMLDRYHANVGGIMMAYAEFADLDMDSEAKMSLALSVVDNFSKNTV